MMDDDSSSLQLATAILAELVNCTEKENEENSNNNSGEDDVDHGSVYCSPTTQGYLHPAAPGDDQKFLDQILLRGLPQYYGLLYKIVGSIIVSLIFVVGLLGNLMVVYVVWRTRSMRTTTNCYLVSLAVADILLLVSAPLPTIAEHFLIVDQSAFGAGGCSVMVFCQYLGVNVSSLSITAFTVERYIAICHPMRAQTMCTVRRAKRIIVSLWTFGVLYCVPWLALTTARAKTFADGTTIESCDFKLERRYYLAYFVADLVIFYVAPLLLTCVLYGLIARVLYLSSGGGASAADSGAEEMPSVAARCPMDDDPPKRKKQKVRVNDPSTFNSEVGKVTARRNASASRIQVTKMLAVVVCSFAVLWLPYRAYVVYNSFAVIRFEDHWFLLFCRLMVYANSAVNPILYNVMSVKFRLAFRRLLCCTRPQGAAAAASTTALNHNVAAATGLAAGQRDTTHASRHVGHEEMLLNVTVD